MHGIQYNLMKLRGTQITNVYTRSSCFPRERFAKVMFLLLLVAHIKHHFPFNHLPFVWTANIPLTCEQVKYIKIIKKMSHFNRTKTFPFISIFACTTCVCVVCGTWCYNGNNSINREKKKKETFFPFDGDMCTCAAAPPPT